MCREDPALVSRLRGQLRPSHRGVRARGRLAGTAARGGGSDTGRASGVHPPSEREAMTAWFPVFLNLFAMGTGASLIAVPYRQIGKYYFNFHSTILLVLVAAAVLIGKPWQLLAHGTAY